MKRILLIISLFHLFIVAGHAQTVVKGTVVNSATGERFAGTRITLIGTTNMTMTEEGGDFSLKVDDSNGLLRVEAPGFDTQIIPLQGRKELLIKMMPVAQSVPVNLSTDDAVQRSLLGDVRMAGHSGLDAAGAALFVRGLHSINMQSRNRPVSCFHNLRLRYNLTTADDIPIERIIFQSVVLFFRSHIPEGNGRLLIGDNFSLPGKLP